MLKALDGRVAAGRPPTSPTVPIRRPGPDTSTGRRPRGGADIGPDGARRRGRAGVVIGVAFLAVVAHVGPRLPGESVTGSVTLTPAQQTARTLAQAETLESQGDAVDAVRLYELGPRQDPNQEQALAEMGWLEYEAGAEAKQGDPPLTGGGRGAAGRTGRSRRLRPPPLPGIDAAGPGRPDRRRSSSTGDFLADHPPRAKVTAAVPFIMRGLLRGPPDRPLAPRGGPAAEELSPTRPPGRAPSWGPRPGRPPGREGRPVVEGAEIVGARRPGPSGRRRRRRQARAPAPGSAPRSQASKSAPIAPREKPGPGAGGWPAAGRGAPGRRARSVRCSVGRGSSPRV